MVYGLIIFVPFSEYDEALNNPRSIEEEILEAKSSLS